MYLLLETISGFLDRFSLVIVGGLLGILVIGLLWRKVPKPTFTKPKTESKVKVVFRDRRRAARIILLIIGVSLWVTGLTSGHFLDLKPLGLYIYFIGWAPYILGAWVL